VHGPVQRRTQQIGHAAIGDDEAPPALLLDVQHRHQQNARVGDQGTPRLNEHLPARQQRGQRPRKVVRRGNLVIRRVAHREPAADIERPHVRVGRGDGLGRPHRRDGLGHVPKLAANMHVDARQAQVRVRAVLVEQRAGVGGGQAELGPQVPGGDVLVRVGADAGVEAQRHLGPRPMLTCQPVEQT